MHCVPQHCRYKQILTQPRLQNVCILGLEIAASERKTEEATVAKTLFSVSVVRLPAFLLFWLAKTVLR